MGLVNKKGRFQVFLALMSVPFISCSHFSPFSDYSSSNEMEKTSTKKIPLSTLLKGVGSEGSVNHAEFIWNKKTRDIASLPQTENNDEKAYLHFLLGEKLSEEEKSIESIEEFKKSLLFKDDKNVKIRLAEEFAALGNYHELKKLYDQILLEEPKNVKIRQIMAQLYVNTGLSEKANSILQEILEIEPGQTASLHLLVELLVDNQKIQEAKKIFEKLEKLEGHDPSFIFLKAKYEFRQKNYKEAKKHLEKIIEIDANYSAAYWMLADLYLQQDLKNKALETLKAIAENSENIQIEAMVYKKIGQILMDQKNYSESIYYFEKYLEYFEDDYTIQVNVGLMLADLKKIPLAQKKFELVLEANPGLESARFYLASLYEDQKNFEKALALFEKISPQFKFFEEVVFHQVSIYLQSNNSLEAIKTLNQAIETKKNSNFYYLLSVIYEKEKQLNQALATLDAGIVSFPEKDSLFYYRGLLLEKTGSLEKAVEAMKDAIKINPQHALALNYIAYTMIEQEKNLEQAEKYLKRAISIKPDDEYIRDSLGWLNFKTGNYKVALFHLEQALKINPREPIFNEHIADIYRKLKLQKNALKYYQLAINYVRKSKETTETGLDNPEYNNLESKLLIKMAALESGFYDEREYLKHVKTDSQSLLGKNEKSKNEHLQNEPAAAKLTSISKPQN